MKIAGDQGVPSDRTPLAELLEQVTGARDSTALAVHIDESAAHVDVRSETHFDDDGMELSPGVKRGTFGAARDEPAERARCP